MLDMKFIREHADEVKENCRKKFQDHKVPMVDELIALDVQNRGCKTKADGLRAQRNALSKQIGGLMAQGKRDEAEAVKAQVKALADEMAELEKMEEELSKKVKEIQMTIPNMIDPSVPIGK
ncbi:MAG: serine--tRNA ligase, partial [Erysipelotrichaceae bacterium]|nr:serine--tRNA ligase [Erysipelotrichaceae bacterium]